MSRSDLDFAGLRQRLLARREELATLSRQDRTAPEPVDIDPSATGQALRQDQLEGQAMALAQHDRHLAELQRIDHALDRLERGGYGRCLNCDEDIATARLLSDPAVATCLSCASAAEHHHHLHG